MSTRLTAEEHACYAVLPARQRQIVRVSFHALPAVRPPVQCSPAPSPLCGFVPGGGSCIQPDCAMRKPRTASRRSQTLSRGICEASGRLRSSRRNDGYPQKIKLPGKRQEVDPAFHVRLPHGDWQGAKRTKRQNVLHPFKWVVIVQYERLRPRRQRILAPTPIDRLSGARHDAETAAAQITQAEPETRHTRSAAVVG